jgi:GT2 family glycosyltransferase
MNLSTPCSGVWQAMPPFLRQALLLGGDAGPRLLHLAEELMSCLETSPQSRTLTDLFVDMVSFAWEASFFDTQAASVAHQVDSQMPFLPASLRSFAEACALARPADRAVAVRFEDLFTDQEMEKVRLLLEDRRRAEAGNLFWFRFARYMGLRLGFSDWYASWLDPEVLPPPILTAMRAELAFAREDWSGAEKLFAAAHGEAPLADFLVKQGECLYRQGRREAAAARWSAALRRRPWQINLLLRLTDVLLGRDLPRRHPDGSGRILLYTWNHAGDLNAALAALAASELGSCGITLLDNGCTDATPEIVGAWRDRLGGRLEVVTLPTNVGAPAARNWLLGLESSRCADWVVFLDDDALVPPDWLGWFGAALAAYPDARVLGCRVVDHAAPLTLQSVDLHFDAGGREADADREARHLSGGSVFVPQALEAADFGQFSYLRPAMSVTGCCHLLTRASITDTGLFDLRFSPSQFDDFDRDLRAALAGASCVYQGRLAVRHIKRSGAMAVGMSPWQRANVGGNMFKLWNTYSNEQVEELIRSADRILWRDLRHRLEETGL